MRAIETNKALIQLNKKGETNIIKGLAKTMQSYAEGIINICNEFSIDGTILQCEIIAIDNAISELKDISNTLDLFVETDNNTRYCCNCGVELTEENRALPNMCSECKYGEER